MKHGKILSLLMTAVFALVAVAICMLEPEPQPGMEVNMPLSVSVLMDGQREQIACWEADDGAYVVFLPSGADLADVTLSQKENVRVLLDGKTLKTEMDCGSLLLDTSYEMLCITEENTAEHTLTFLQSAQLPSMHVDVRSGTMEIIHADKGNQESGSVRLYSATGSLVYSGLMESLKGRGNSSWLGEKKPYAMTLSGDGDLLGMGQAQNWILLANTMDPSHLRNKAVYDFAAKTGAVYAPESQWVDLYLNGTYAGVYLLCERNEIHPQRLNLSLAGGFLVSRESGWRLVSQNYPHIITDSGAALRIHDSGLTEKDLYRVWQPVENAILAEDGIDPLTGKHWTQLIDLDSWAIEYLTAEMFGNVDAGTISAYFYRDGRDPSGKIYAGPVWDYDLSLGSKGTWQTEYTQVFYGDKAHIWKLEDTTWFYWLNKKPEFQNRVRTLYKTVYRPLAQELLETGLADYAACIQPAVRLDQRRWNTTGALEETENIRQYLAERLAFLDSVWIESDQYYKVLVLLDENSSSVCHAVSPGETIPELPEYEESWDVLGWYDADAGESFDIAQPVYRDTVVHLKKIPTEDTISPLQAVPIIASLGILGILVLADRKRWGTQVGKKSIAKQKNV